MNSAQIHLNTMMKYKYKYTDLKNCKYRYKNEYVFLDVFKYKYRYIFVPNPDFHYFISGSDLKF